MVSVALPERGSDNNPHQKRNSPGPGSGLPGFPPPGFVRPLGNPTLTGRPSLLARGSVLLSSAAHRGPSHDSPKHS